MTGINQSFGPPGLDQRQRPQRTDRLRRPQGAALKERFDAPKTETPGRLCGSY